MEEAEEGGGAEALLPALSAGSFSIAERAPRFFLSLCVSQPLFPLFTATPLPSPRGRRVGPRWTT